MVRWHHQKDAGLSSFVSECMSLLQAQIEGGRVRPLDVTMRNICIHFHDLRLLHVINLHVFSQLVVLLFDRFLA